MGGGETNGSDSLSSQEDSVESLLYDLCSLNSEDNDESACSIHTQREELSVQEEKNDELINRMLSSNSSESDVFDIRRLKDYEEIMENYKKSKVRAKGLEQAKQKILSYKPGVWSEEVGCLTMDDYDIPKTTTLLLVGLSGSGKSSLVNRISRVFEDDQFTLERAQVSYNCVGDGTSFLHEYMIPRGSTSFCLYDTRGLYENPYDNDKMIKSWMTEGVRHGELVLRDADSPSDRSFMKCKARHTVYSKERRMVNFVIFVIDALSVLKVIDGEEDVEYSDLLEGCFNCPYLSCKDNKPVVVCTHGDLLSHEDRARVRIHLGELLGIPPAKQIFDIPENCDPETDLAVVDMLTYSLMHADQNFPIKRRSPSKVLGIGMITLLCVSCLILLWNMRLTFEPKDSRAIWEFISNLKNKAENLTTVQGTPISKSWQGIHVDWHKIRHLW
ncbi:hypothetical protein ACHQM5_028042 [Ranunculus cassubicifolius]